MDPGLGDVLAMPTLGRPFALGMLYDQRSDKLLPGVTLWDPEVLQKDLISRPLPKTEFDVLSEDKIENKTSALDINASLKLSFLGGLINVEGSAKYLDDRKQSSQIARVTLKYECTTKFEQLSMKHLGKGNIKYQYVFDAKSATHVVVGLSYGAKAFFIFDREITDKEEQKQVHGNLKVMVKSIPNFSIEGEAALELTEAQKQNVDKMHCVFYGDFLLKRNPTTFVEAVKLYNELPKLLGDNYEKAVAVQVWLYPLSKLDSKAAQLVREISTGLVTQTEELFEKFHAASEVCNDLMKSDIYDHFPDIKKSITQFHSYLQTYIVTFKTKLLGILPEIRGGGVAEEGLAQLFRDNELGPFNKHELTNWLDGKQKETKILEAYMHVMKDTQFMTAPGALDSKIAKEHEIVCFHFHINSTDDQHLTDMREHLYPDSAENKNHEEECTDENEYDELMCFENDLKCSKKPWFELSDTKRAMRETAHAFGSYKKVNPDICFIVSTEDDETKESGCSIQIYKDGEIIEKTFKPPSPPGVPVASDVTFDSITLNWIKPHNGAESIQHYKIFYKSLVGPEWTCIESTSADEKYCLNGLQPNTLYTFKVQGVCRVGCSPESDVSENIKTDIKKKTLAEKMMENTNSKLVSSQPDTYRLPLSLLRKDQKTRLRHFTLGHPTAVYTQHKVLMLVGATGAGKSTLLNGIVNYLLDVKWTDAFRFKVVTPEDEESENANNQAFSQTEYITAYTFYHQTDMPVPYQLTIIDTPGYGDCRGIKRDKEITRQIKEFFTDYDIVDHLDAVCFVTPAPGRLTHTQRYIIDSILAIYAKNIAENIVFLVTFADGQKPPVLDSIREANIPYRDFFKFNNSALFADNSGTDDASVDGMFWKMGIVSMENFFKEIQKIEPKSLKLTKQVLQKRLQMETMVQGIQPQIKTTILQMNNLEKEKEYLQKYESQIKDNTNWEYTVQEEFAVKHDKKPGTYVTNCLKCSITCHENCAFANDEDKQRCSAISGNNCRICPGKCHWTMHHNMPFKWETETRTVKKIYEETKKNYNVALKGKEGKEQLIARMKQSYDSLKKGVLSLMHKVKNCIVRLGEIALRPSPLSTTDYIDLLIASEEREGKRGWEERTKHLQEVRREAEIVEKIKEGTFEID